MTGSDDALEQLISQFAQPLAFLRELVQNSLDAGTNLIEVTVDYDKEAKCCFVSVKDTGQGMNREIIDTKLTRLFSSTKEDDLTKIGKFGIGFVSIFAVKPKLVVLETGRDGEFWRVLFKPDRSFEKRELDHPVEGTNVTVYTPKPQQQLKKLTADARDTVRYWCKHSDVEITFNGVPINQEFKFLAADYQYRHKIEGTEAVLAPSIPKTGFHGYYNRGLTLLEGEGSPIPHLSFIMRSRYLEHTLSRDNILMDKQYDKAMKQVRKAAFSLMPKDLFGQLESKDCPKLWRAARIVKDYEGVAKLIRKHKIFIGREQKLALADIPETFFTWPEVDDFWTEVEATKATILMADPFHLQLRFLEDLGHKNTPLDEAFLRYRTSEPSEADQYLLKLLSEHETKLPKPVMVETLGSAPKVFRGRLAIFLHPDRRVRHVHEQERKRGDRLGLNANHRLVKKIANLSRWEPELAAAVLLRKIRLDLGLGTKSEGKATNRLLKVVREKAVSR